MLRSRRVIILGQVSREPALAGRHVPLASAEVTCDLGDAVSKGLIVDGARID